jgi:4-hydroxy-L-threonine phosphate dehydrogenase PdxA
VLNPSLRGEGPATISLKHDTILCTLKQLMTYAVIFWVNVKFVNLSLCHGTAVNNEVEYGNMLSRAFLLKKQFHYCVFEI